MLDNRDEPLKIYLKDDRIYRQWLLKMSIQQFWHFFVALWCSGCENRSEFIINTRGTTWHVTFPLETFMFLATTLFGTCYVSVNCVAYNHESWKCGSEKIQRTCEIFVQRIMTALNVDYSNQFNNGIINTGFPKMSFIT